MRWEELKIAALRYHISQSISFFRTQYSKEWWRASSWRGARERFPELSRSGAGGSGLGPCGFCQCQEKSFYFSCIPSLYGWNYLIRLIMFTQVYRLVHTANTSSPREDYLIHFPGGISPQGRELTPALLVTRETELPLALQESIRYHSGHVPGALIYNVVSYLCCWNNEPSLENTVFLYLHTENFFMLDRFSLSVSVVTTHGWLMFFLLMLFLSLFFTNFSAPEAPSHMLHKDIQS